MLKFSIEYEILKGSANEIIALPSIYGRIDLLYKKLFTVAIRTFIRGFYINNNQKNIKGFCDLI